MKTLHGIVNALIRTKKKELRVPKKMWRVDIQWPEGLWSGFVSECPTFRNLHEVWAAEYQEACTQHARVTDPDTKARWCARFSAARFLQQAFKEVATNKAGIKYESKYTGMVTPTRLERMLMVSDGADRPIEFDIDITEEVLH